MSQPLRPPLPLELCAAGRRVLGRLGARAIRLEIDPHAAVEEITSWPPLDRDIHEDLQCMTSRSVLERRAGLFVTLYKGGRLRGCMGTAVADGPLWSVVQRIACRASQEDPRYRPLREEELCGLQMEITILGTLVALPADADVRVESLKPGEHGVWLRSGDRRGLYLPKVAARLGWDSDQLLSETAKKAGLDAGAWRRSDAEVYVFHAREFDVDGDILAAEFDEA